MRRILSTAAIFGMTLTGTQTSADAETWYLVLATRVNNRDGVAAGISTLPMESEDQCQAAGLALQGNKKIHRELFHLEFQCVKGK